MTGRSRASLPGKRAVLRPERKPLTWQLASLRPRRGAHDSLHGVRRREQRTLDRWKRVLMTKRLPLRREQGPLTRVQASLTRVQASLTRVQVSLARVQALLTRVQASLRSLRRLLRRCKRRCGAGKPGCYLSGRPCIPGRWTEGGDPAFWAPSRNGRVEGWARSRSAWRRWPRPPASRSCRRHRRSSWLCRGPRLSRRGRLGGRWGGRALRFPRVARRSSPCRR